MKTITDTKVAVMRLAISPSGFTFDPQTGRSFTLNITGLTALNLLKEGHSPEDITSKLAQEYGQPPERIEVELDNFWSLLQRQLGGSSS